MVNVAPLTSVAEQPARPCAGDHLAQLRIEVDDVPRVGGPEHDRDEAQRRVHGDGDVARGMDLDRGWGLHPRAVEQVMGHEGAADDRGQDGVDGGAATRGRPQLVALPEQAREGDLPVERDGRDGLGCLGHPPGDHPTDHRQRAKVRRLAILPLPCRVARASSDAVT